MSTTVTPDPARRSFLAELTGLRIHVISEEPVVRAGIRSLLEARSQTIAFVDDLKTQGADVVFFDVLGLCHNRGRELEVLAERCPGRVLALSRALQPGLTARALELGAIAAVPLGAGPDELLQAVDDLFEGRFHDGSAADLANRRDRDHRLGRDACLTPRERQVLALIVAGASNRQITAELDVTENTVKSFIRGAYNKIGVRTRSQAVAWGVDHGFPTRRVHHTR